MIVDHDDPIIIFLQFLEDSNRHSRTSHFHRCNDKEFQIMIVKMIQNLETKMEPQIKSLETRIEKMQERFNKDLEEKKESIYNE